MWNSSRAGVNRRLLGLVAVCCAVLLGGVSSKAIAQTTLYFSGACSDCTGTGNLSLTLPSFVGGDQTTFNNAPVEITYSSNLLGNLTSDSYPGAAEVWAGTMSALPTSTYEFMQLEWTVNNVSYDFTSCGNDTVVGQTGNVCGAGGLAFGDWQICQGCIFSGQAGKPAGGGHVVQNDMGTDGLWTTTAPTVVAAPEIDAGSAVGALVLLLGSLAVMGGRRTRAMTGSLAA
jgi:hypothetical protein